MKQKNDKLNDQPLREQALKGIKDMMGNHKGLFKENPISGSVSKKKYKTFKDLKKWNDELEKINREEIVITKSLKELNIRISDAINRRSVPKSNTKSSNLINAKEKNKINASMIKIEHIVKKSRAVKDFPKDIANK